MQKCTVHGGRTKRDIKHIFTRLTEQKSFISSSCIIIANIKCTIWQVSILENRFSGKCPFGQMYFLESVRLGKCTFGTMSIRPSAFRGNVLSGRCFSGRCTGFVFKVQCYRKNSKRKKPTCHNELFLLRTNATSRKEIRASIFNACWARRLGNKQRWSPRGRPWPRERPRGHILKSLALASKP